MRKRATTIPGLLNTSKVLIPFILLLWAKIIGPGSGVLKKCYAGRLLPKVQPLNLLSTIFWKKWYPFHIPCLEFYPFNYRKCTVLKVWINHKTRMFSRLFHSHKMHMLAHLGLFTDRNDRFSYHFIYFVKDFTTLPVFPLRPNIIIGSLTQYQLIPFQRIYLKCYLNLTNPKCAEVYVVNNPEFCHIDTCSKKIQSEIIMQIKTLLRATFKHW